MREPDEKRKCCGYEHVYGVEGSGSDNAEEVEAVFGLGFVHDFFEFVARLVTLSIIQLSF